MHSKTNNIDIIGYSTLAVLLTYFLHMPTIKSNEIKRKKILYNNYKLYTQGIHDPLISSCAIFHKKIFEKIKNMKTSVVIPTPIFDIYQEFENHVDEINLENCLFNMKKLKIDNHHKITRLLTSFDGVGIISGRYWPSRHTIEVNLPTKRVLCHEFLHMASTNYKTQQLSGFHLYSTHNNKKVELGIGINEGCTEFLNGKIFGKSVSYGDIVDSIELLETFFDNPKDLETYYFHNDLFSLFKVFNNAGGTLEEFYTILNQFDYFATAYIPYRDIVPSMRVQKLLYEIIKRSENKEKIRNFEKIYFQDPTIKFLENKNLLSPIEPISKTYEYIKARKNS